MSEQEETNDLVPSAALLAFLAEHPLRTVWLSDIIDVLAEEPGGTASVPRIEEALAAKYDGESIYSQQTISRIIGNYSAEDPDWDETDGEPDFFGKVGSDTWKLRAFPGKPNVIDILEIEFLEPAMQDTWNSYENVSQEQLKLTWDDMPNTRRLEVFVNSFKSDSHFKSFYEERKEALAK